MLEFIVNKINILISIKIIYSEKQDAQINKLENTTLKPQWDSPISVS